MCRAELVLNAGAKHGESPYWCNNRKALFWLDITDRKVHTYDPVKNTDKVHSLDILPTSLIHKRGGGFLVTSLDGVYSYDEDFAAKKLILPLEEDDTSTRFNDAKADPSGRLWAGSMQKDGLPGKGTLYRINGDYSYKTILSPVDISNGIVWSTNNKMYYTDSLSGEIQKFDYDPETGDISNRSTEFKFENEIPDGMAIDSENNIWAALWGEGKVVCIDTKMHKVSLTVDVEAKLTSAVAFGGDDLSTLYITTSRLGLSEKDVKNDPLSGGLFKFETGIRGTLFNEFIEKS